MLAFRLDLHELAVRGECGDMAGNQFVCARLGVKKSIMNHDPIPLLGVENNSSF